MRLLPIAVTAFSIGTLLAACEPGAGPFQPSPWAGFPPSFAEAPFNQYQAQYQADQARYTADPGGFMRRGSQRTNCELPMETQKAFAAAGFMARPEHAAPTWEKVQATYGREDFAPIIDQVSVQVLEGDCAGGSLNGSATVRATFLRVTPGMSPTSYYATQVELLETCTYRDFRREGDCRRFETLVSQNAEMSPDGKLILAEGLAGERSFVADYGRYSDDQEASPGVRFETTTAMAGHESNMTLARYPASNNRLRYDEYVGGAPPAVTFYRRISDGVLHGPVVAKGGLVTSCYDEGVEVIRAAGCTVE